MEISGNLYNRLLEGIGDGIAAALTRKPVEPESGLDIHVPEDSSSFSKHSRLWHWLDGYLRRDALKEFGEFGDYAEIEPDDAKMLSLLFADGNGEDVEKVCRREKVFETLYPKDVDELYDAMKTFTGNAWIVRWMREMPEDSPFRRMFDGISMIDGGGNEFPATEFDRHGIDVRYVRYSDDVLKGRKSIVISVDWESQVSFRTWQAEGEKIPGTPDFCRECDDFETEEKANEFMQKHVDGYALSRKAADGINDIDGKHNIHPGMSLIDAYRHIYHNSISAEDYLPAIHAALRYTDTVGGRKLCGYLPSAMQLRTMHEKMMEIGLALSLCGADGIQFIDTIDTGYLWSSSEDSYYQAWHLDGESNLIPTDKGDECGVIPLFAFVK